MPLLTLLPYLLTTLLLPVYAQFNCGASGKKANTKTSKRDSKRSQKSEGLATTQSEQEHESMDDTQFESVKVVPTHWPHKSAVRLLSKKKAVVKAKHSEEPVDSKPMEEVVMPTA
ncbi:unnamed protein product, partial [Mesorhabditis spiculigera]